MMSDGRVRNGAPAGGPGGGVLFSSASRPGRTLPVRSSSEERLRRGRTVTRRHSAGNANLLVRENHPRVTKASFAWEPPARNLPGPPIPRWDPFALRAMPARRRHSQGHAGNAALHRRTLMDKQVRFYLPRRASRDITSSDIS